MAKGIFVLVALVAAAPAFAQTRPNPGVAAVIGTLPPMMYQTDDVLRFGVSASGDTPTMRRQRIAWAMAVRNKALQLQAEDGGTLSDQHARYIRSRISRIVQ